MKRKLTWVFVAAAATVLALTSAGYGLGANQATTKLAADLNARQEAPKPRLVVTKAKGRFEAVLSGKGSRLRLRWSVRWTRTSGRVLQAHIHFGRRGKAGKIAVGLCGPCGRSRDSGSAGGQIFVSTKVARALRGGTTYVNLHTKKNPNGEIRGQIRLASNIGR